jgi:glycosyltransferase involved in cell wall biosynthesis
MPKLEESRSESEQRPAPLSSQHSSPRLAVTVIVPARNEAANLPRCLESLRGAGEVYVIDSQSTDATVEVAHSYGAQVVQFHYQGGWPKKRQWAMESLPLAYDWILLVDADESLTPQLEQEIRSAIEDREFDGYYIALRVHFLGRELRHCGARFYKLSLFRRGKGRYECRLREQDASMADMEVHEHVMVEGKTAKLKHPLLHHNIESLSRYIRKHDEYSNWEARVWSQGQDDQPNLTKTSAEQLPPSLFGSQAQRRRWLKGNFLALPGSSLLFFLYKYVWLLGFLDGIPGLIFCVFQGIQFFQVKAKIYELKIAAAETSSRKV